jgi:uncharacterized protein
MLALARHRALVIGGLAASALFLGGLALVQQPEGGRGEGRAGQPPAMRVTMRETLITASGSATIKRTPDRAIVSLGASVTEKTPGPAHDKLNTIMAKVVQNIRDLNIEGIVIQTAWLNLTPQYDYRAQREGEEPRISGYRASNVVTVEVKDPSKIGPVIDAAMNGGANTVNNISFGLKEDESVKKEALSTATRDARAQAEAMASALGLRITRVVEVNSGPVAIPYQPRRGGMDVMAMESAKAISAPAVVEAGEASWTAHATVVFAAEPRE